MKTLYPERVQIETYHGCNARCIMCPIKNSKRKNGEMPEEIFNEIVNQLYTFRKSLRVITLYMGGEPLIDRHIAERVEKCKSAGLPNVGFSTHASLLNDEKAERIIQAGTDWLAISFESLKADVYESIRVGLNFNRVLNNILSFIELRNKKKSNLKISMRFISLNENSFEFDEYLMYFSRLLDREKDEIRKLEYSNWGHPKKGEEYYGNEPCPHVFERLPVLSDGTVSICSADYDPEYCLGNVMNENIENIWNNHKWQEIRRLHRNGKRMDMPLCDVCNVPSLKKETYFFGKHIKN